MPRRIQLRKPHDGPKAIACTRRSGRLGPIGPYGNPYIVGVDGTAEQCVEQFRRLYDNPLARARFREELRGKDLACLCPVSARWCHVDVLLRWANAPAD